MFRHNLQHTGRSPYVGPSAPELKWAYGTGGIILSSPAIGADGTIYVGSWDRKLYAIKPVGTEVKALALLFLRAGYSTKFKEDTRRESKIIPTGITCGLGFKLEGERKLGLDYAFAPCGNLGPSHRVNLSLFL